MAKDQRKPIVTILRGKSDKLVVSAAILDGLPVVDMAIVPIADAGKPRKGLALHRDTVPALLIALGMAAEVATDMEREAAE